MNENATQQTKPAAPLPWAMPIADAARMVGLSYNQFRRVFLLAGRVRCLCPGKHDRIIDTAELQAAYEVYKSELRGTE